MCPLEFSLKIFFNNTKENSGEITLGRESIFQTSSRQINIKEKLQVPLSMSHLMSAKYYTCDRQFI